MIALGPLLRQTVYQMLRAGSRALSLSSSRLDGLQENVVGQPADRLTPPSQCPATEAGSSFARRPLQRAGEAAIGHVPYRSASLPATLPATLVAFYLPQFHSFEQNDAWWGKGFTEWRNVTRALPQFEGHLQPRLPGELGFYDLRTPQVMREQATLASEYGIGAFCFYFYWFSGTTLMELPLRQWLADESIELPFCLCWANENWARRWDGRNEDILIGQQHSAEDDIAFISYVADYLRDRRALRVDGKPMLLVYRPHLLPDTRATAKRWRQWCRDNGIGEIHLAYVQGFERPDPRDIDFDAAVEFPPNMSNPRSLSANQYLINPDFEGDVRDWRDLATEMSARPLPDYPLYPGVNPGWDNQARRSGKGRVFLHASPRGYRDWLSNTIHRRLAGAPNTQKLVFINAWNEWAESAVLEPDMRLGYAYLEATKQALQLRQVVATPARPCVVIHVGHPEALGELLSDLQRSELICRLIITTAGENRPTVEAVLRADNISAEILTFENHGRDILPFLHVADLLLEQGEDVVLKLHARCWTDAVPGARSDQESMQELLVDKGAVAAAAFAQQPRLGLLAPQGHLLPVRDGLGTSAEALDRLSVRLGLRGNVHDAVFGAGGMFWVRLAALRPLLDAHLAPSAFQAEEAQVHGTLARSIECLLGAVCEDAGYTLEAMGTAT